MACECAACPGCRAPGSRERSSDNERVGDV